MAGFGVSNAGQGNVSSANYSLVPRVAYWGNLFHYILQGLVTNELAENSYNLPLNLEVGGNIAQIILPGPGLSSIGANVVNQTAAFVGLVMAAGPGINNASNPIGDIRSLITCLVDNNCLVEPIMANVAHCVLGPAIISPCKNEFEAAIESLPLEETTKCFIPSFEGEPVMDSSNSLVGVPDDFSLEAYNDLQQEDRIGLILCLLQALLPEGVVDIVEQVIELIKKIYNIVLIVIDVIEGGIDLPGELILFFFGWAELDNGEFVAPYKWHYCMTAVVVFLVCLEIFKLIAVRFIVWTKR
jgi:hypothetical protein